MESLGDTLWDVVICGTDLQQSLLALSLSRSGKKILHIDPNGYYGGTEAAFSLQEAESWVTDVAATSVAAATNGTCPWRSASICKPEAAATEGQRAATGLSFPRAYSLALAPQIIHARSDLLSQLVSSRAYRQIEFLAVGSFYIFKASAPAQASKEMGKPTLSRIPATREDVFSTTAITAKAKRGLMKFLKFVMDYDSPPQTESWGRYADVPLTEFVQMEFKMDNELQTYIVALTLSLDGRISTKDGLAVIHRHLTSMGVFGSGFAAVYPKWGGLSEIAQVACRAAAVGGAVYMLGTDIKTMQKSSDTHDDDLVMSVELSSGDTIKTRMLVRASVQDHSSTGDGVSGAMGISRLVTVIDTPLKSLFAAVVEGSPTPAVAVITFPVGSVATATGKVSENPVYVFAHSSDTGECPVGQSVLYFTTLSTPDSKEILMQAMDSLLTAIAAEEHAPRSLFQLHYEQARGATKSQTQGLIFDFPSPSLSLSFDDSSLEPVRQAWSRITDESVAEMEYMTFPDREGAMSDEDEMYT